MIFFMSNSFRAVIDRTRESTTVINMIFANNRRSLPFLHRTPNNNTMITSSNTEHSSSNDAEINPQKIQAVHEEFGKLQNVLSSLSGKLSGVLQSREDEFLSCYKSHMRNVARDFRGKMDEIEGKEKAIENHTVVKKLEKERDWYKSEAFQLDAALTRTKARESELLEKCRELERDRKCLSNQLKEIMKEKKSMYR